MIVCDYVTDLGRKFPYYRPFIIGIDTRSNEFLSSELVLLTLSNYIDASDYYEITDKARTCGMGSRARRLVLDLPPVIIEVEYPRPFRDLDWSVFTDLDVKAETIPEFINDSEVNMYLKDWS